MKRIAVLTAFTLAAGVQAQQKAGHVAELRASEKQVAEHAHEIVHMKAVTKAAAQAHAAGIAKALDAADAHLAAAEKEKTDAAAKLALAEIRRDHVAARKHLGALNAELAKAKVNGAAVKEHAEGVDSAIDDAVELNKKLDPHAGMKH